MGCATSNVQEFQKTQPQAIGINSLSPPINSNNMSQTPKVSLAYSSLANNLTSPTLKDTQSKRQYQDEEYVYTLKSFHTIEKISENSVYKQFRVINNHTNTVQMMYVVPLTYAIKHQTISSLMQLKEKNLININHVFSDDNFRYIITDLAIVNIYDAVFYYTSFTIDKIKKVLRSILTAINYIYEQSESVLHLDYSKIRILNESFAVKLEYFDIKYLIFYNEETNPIENVLFEFGKIVLILLNTKREIPFSSYKDLDLETIYSSEELIEEYPIELIEVLEVLLSGQEKNISKILSMAYFTNQNTLPLDKNIQDNDAFYSFYSKYFLYKSTNKFLKSYLLSKENGQLYESLLDNFDNEESNEINTSILTDNIKAKMPNRYTQFEMTEIVSVLSKVQLSKFSQKQIVMMITDYESALCKDQVKKAFDLFDENDTGRIEVEQLKEIFDLYVKKDHDGELNEIIAEVDKADDHMITFNEFLYVLTKMN